MLDFIPNWGKRYYKAFMYYKEGQVLWEIGSVFCIIKRVNVIVKQDRYQKYGQFLLQNGAGITKWGNYYKVGQHNSPISNITSEIEVLTSTLNEYYWAKCKLR